MAGHQRQSRCQVADLERRIAPELFGKISRPSRLASSTRALAQTAMPTQFTSLDEEGEEACPRSAEISRGQRRDESRDATEISFCATSIATHATSAAHTADAVRRWHAAQSATCVSGPTEIPKQRRPSLRCRRISSRRCHGGRVVETQKGRRHNADR